MRAFSSATISTACAWWPIIPCMNLTSAAVCWTFERSTALSAEMTWVASPGAPGWTIAGPEDETFVLRHAPAATERTHTPTERVNVLMMAKGYTFFMVNR